VLPKLGTTSIVAAHLCARVREGRKKTLYGSKGRFFPHPPGKSLILRKSRTISSESSLFNGLHQKFGGIVFVVVRRWRGQLAVGVGEIVDDAADLVEQTLPLSGRSYVSLTNLESSGRKDPKFRRRSRGQPGSGARRLRFLRFGRDLLVCALRLPRCVG
jgi:hypothetical protein